MFANHLTWVLIFHVSSFVTSTTLFQQKNNSVAHAVVPGACDEVLGEYDVCVKTFAVGQGDATLVECGSKYGLLVSLIDMGSDMFTNVLSKKEYVNQMMNIYKARRLRHIFLTHADMDHLNWGLAQSEPPQVSENSGLLWRIVNDPKPLVKVVIHISSEAAWNGNLKEWFIQFVKRYSDWFDLQTHVARNEKEGMMEVINVKTDICKVAQGSNTFIEIIDAEVGIQQGGNPAKPNSNSMVMMLHNNEERMLFLGDFETQSAYERLLQKHGGNLNANYVMVPHHGADDSTTSFQTYLDFYEAVGAKTAIISSHIAYHQGHPKLRIIDAFCGREQSSDSYCDLEYENCPYGIVQGYKTFVNERRVTVLKTCLDKNNNNKEIYQTTRLNVKTYKVEWYNTYTVLQSSRDNSQK